MATDKIATAANKLRRDIESRYLCKCSFDGSCVSSGVQLTCRFDDWNFTYKICGKQPYIELKELIDKNRHFKFDENE